MHEEAVHVMHEEAVHVSYSAQVLDAAGLIGFGLILFSAALILWGLVNVIFVRNPALLTLHAILSLLPGAISAVIGVYAYSYFVEVAMSPSAPEATEFASVISFGFVNAIAGQLGTLVSGGLGILALAKVAFAARDSREAEPRPEYVGKVAV